jgi:uncharacterized repeat protein (TIGR03803 family)
MPAKRCMKVLALGFALVYEFVLLTTPVSAAATEQVLHSFNYSDGTHPYGGLIVDAAGNMYGTTSQDGPTGAGTVFELIPNGSGQWGYQVLYNFCSVSGCSDGIGPMSGLILDSAGNLYGTTSQGGNAIFGCGHGCGTVFQLSPSSGGSWTETVLYAFSDGGDGATPIGGLVLDSAGNLYGTTSSGGASSIYCAQGCGVLFMLKRGANGLWTEQVLHSFCSVSGCIDGAVPNGLIFDTAGNLYCTTSQLGRYNGGTLFQLTPSLNGGWRSKMLYAFGNGTDGALPNPGLVFDADGNMYGTTNTGGPYHSGIVFEIIPGASGEWTEKIVHAFCSATNCLDGGLPLAGVTVGAAGHLYGTASVGGSSGGGTVFVMTAATNGHWKETVLYDSYSGNLDQRLTLDTVENLFSMTTDGGNFYLGSLFEITP